MGLLDFIPVVGPAVDAALGATNAIMAQHNFGHRYQTEVKDLKAAGLNPALAYGQSPGGGAQTNLPMIGDEITSAAATAEQAKATRAARENQEVQNDLLRAQANELVQRARLENDALRSNIANTQAGTARTEVGTKQDQANLELFNQTYGNKVFLSDYEREQAKKKLDITDAELDQILTNNRLLKLGVPKAQAESRFYTGMGKWSPQLNTALGVLGAIKGFIK
ncbi:MAG: DNA pilot protein [Microvirus sp.]|nr:MAG: DNA pilot protein [Microvirus sp.]